jgi:hypothetical protein
MDQPSDALDLLKREKGLGIGLEAGVVFQVSLFKEV